MRSDQTWQVYHNDINYILTYTNNSISASPWPSGVVEAAFPEAPGKP
jgi:hypothetical protein